MEHTENDAEYRKRCQEQIDRQQWIGSGVLLVDASEEKAIVHEYEAEPKHVYKRK